LSVPSDVQVWNENLIGNFLQFTVNHGVWYLRIIKIDSFIVNHILWFPFSNYGKTKETKWA
jgi:hypothetical protein